MPLLHIRQPTVKLNTRSKAVLIGLGGLGQLGSLHRENCFPFLLDFIQEQLQVKVADELGPRVHVG